MSAYSTAIVLADVSIPQPDPSKLPGGDAFMGLVSGLLAFALIAAVAGIAISAITWAFGSHNSNPHIASRGKVGVLASVGAAVLIGSAVAIVNFFYHTGGTVHAKRKTPYRRRENR